MNEQLISDVLEENYMPYTMSVIISRALPSIDGFKPSHRKLLYTMYKMNLLNGAKTKSANIVGQTMKLNPHGDQAIYETMVRLAQKDTLLLPYVDGKGNFGQHTSRDMQQASARYTEAKLGNISHELFKNIDKNVVDFVDNYDNTTKEPLLLPTTFPNILVNSNMGIAVGMASNICSFNLREVCNATIEYIKDNNVDLLEYLLAPDFATGGELLYNKDELKKIYETGLGSIKLRAKWDYNAKDNSIIITEIPYTTTREAIMDKIIQLIKDNKVKEINDVRDETDLKGMRIAIDLKRGTDYIKLMNKLLALTPLQDSFGCNFNILVENKPVVLGVRDIISEWIKFRIDCIKRQILFDVDKKEKTLHLLEGLDKILLDIDLTIKLIRESKSESVAMSKLKDQFKIDDEQASYIANIKLININKDYILNKTKEIKTLKDDIKTLKSVYGNKDSINNLIITQLTEIANKYGSNRKTDINKCHVMESYTREVENYNIVFFMTKEGYFKKVPLTSLRNTNEHRLKDDDMIVEEINGCNLSDVLLFSNKGVCYKLKAYEVEDCKLSSLGEYLPTLLSLANGEKILKMVITDNYEGYMLFSYDIGKIAKIDLKSYQTKQNRGKLLNAYNTDLNLVGITYITNDIKMLVKSNIDKILVFDTAEINSKTARTSIGVNVLKSKNNSNMTMATELNKVDGLTDWGYYFGAIPAVGKFLKKEDKIRLI